MTRIPLLVVCESRVDFLQAVRVLKGLDGVHKIYAVLAKILGSFAPVPFVLHSKRRTGYQYWQQAP